MLEVKINLHGGTRLPQQYGDWIDLAASETMHFYKDTYRLIPLGVSMELPDGYYAEMVARSSTFRKYGILMVNGLAVIDHDYCGDGDIWHFPAYATRNVRIEKGTRIAQFRLVKCPEEVKFIQVDKLDGQNRGGLGSTDSKE